MQIENAGQRSSVKIGTSVNKLWHGESSAVEKSRVSLCTRQKDEAITQDQFAVCGRSGLQFSVFLFFFSLWDVRNRLELCVGSQAGCSRSALFLLPLVSVGKGQAVIRSNMVVGSLHNCSFSSFICIIYLRVRRLVFPRSSSSFQQWVWTRRNTCGCLLFPFLHDLLCFHFLQSHALVSSIHHHLLPRPPHPTPTDKCSFFPPHTSLTKCKAQSSVWDWQDAKLESMRTVTRANLH